MKIYHRVSQILAALAVIAWVIPVAFHKRQSGFAELGVVIFIFRALAVVFALLLHATIVALIVRRRSRESRIEGTRGLTLDSVLLVTMVLGFVAFEWR